jgi:hypothetical protein
VDSPLVQLRDILLALLVAVQDPYDVDEYSLPDTEFELMQEINDKQIVYVVSER